MADPSHWSLELSKADMVMRALTRLRPSRIERVEVAAQLAQGKGWGTATTQQEAAAVRTLLAPKGIPRPLVLDVGANIGDWTLAMLRVMPHCQIHSFEPSEGAFALLEQRLRREDRVTVHQLALGRSAGSATLYADRSGSGLASLTRRRLDHHGLEMRLEEQVDVMTLDDWVHEAQVDRVDVLKMDVEGHELDVLAGAARTLPQVSVVQFEFGGCNIDTRTFFQDFWYLLTDAGFRLFRLGPRGLSALDRYRETDEVFTTTNFFGMRRTA